MNTTLFQSFSFPRLMILASAVLSGLLLAAAPMVLPHVSPAETSATPISSSALTHINGIPEPVHLSKPSAAHRASHSAPKKASYPSPAIAIEPFR